MGTSNNNVLDLSNFFFESSFVSTGELNLKREEGEMIEEVLRDTIREGLKEELAKIFEKFNLDNYNSTWGERLLSIPKAAERLDCSRTQVYNFHIEKMGLKTCNKNGRIKIRESDLNDYIKNLK